MDNQINQSESSFQTKSGFAEFSKEQWASFEDSLKMYLFENTEKGMLVVDNIIVEKIVDGKIVGKEISHDSNTAH